jgi:hypothetical protein
MAREFTMRKLIVLGLLALVLGLAFCINARYQVAYCFDDWASGGIQRLWTTNSTGEEEINVFNIGDPVYLKTNPNALYPLGAGVRGNFTVYIFEGNIVLNSTLEGHEGDKIPDDIGTLAAPPLDIHTNFDGHFGQDSQGGPVLIWNSAALGQFTIVLDKKCDWNGVPDANYGYWHSGTDYREDGCTAVPTPPGFFVIPDVPLGTLAAIVSLFCGLGFFAKIKKKSCNA